MFHKAVVFGGLAVKSGVFGACGTNFHFPKLLEVQPDILIWSISERNIMVEV
ncbi:hypothetical protein Runsl_1507 [Runella slithyformis DSM 19594]|uniref:Uncharacterized protein n=1 Tax=Runella slithyformis (strain ATCC 29530 / DSM 19594 / LMG 11500 / NCIMB 11436 / LSU 4) TaxID=761193 RepID=A0A7U3ZIT1_RUNSL|nr:hypothetical protein Runsl_1507 [Runella slithyformis DSM 19594]